MYINVRGIKELNDNHYNHILVNHSSSISCIEKIIISYGIFKVIVYKYVKCIESECKYARRNFVTYK